MAVVEAEFIHETDSFDYPAEPDTSRVFTYTHQNGETLSGTVLDMERCAVLGSLPLKQRVSLAELNEMGQALLDKNEDSSEELEETEVEEEAREKEKPQEKTETKASEKDKKNDKVQPKEIVKSNVKKEETSRTNLDKPNSQEAAAAKTQLRPILKMATVKTDKDRKQEPKLLQPKNNPPSTNRTSEKKPVIEKSSTQRVVEPKVQPAETSAPTLIKNITKPAALKDSVKTNPIELSPVNFAPVQKKPAPAAIERQVPIYEPPAKEKLLQNLPIPRQPEARVIPRQQVEPGIVRAEPSGSFSSFTRERQESATQQRVEFVASPVMDLVQEMNKIEPELAPESVYGIEAEKIHETKSILVPASDIQTDDFFIIPESDTLSINSNPTERIALASKPPQTNETAQEFLDKSADFTLPVHSLVDSLSLARQRGEESPAVLSETIYYEDLESAVPVKEERVYIQNLQPEPEAIQTEVSDLNLKFLPEYISPVAEPVVTPNPEFLYASEDSEVIQPEAEMVLDIDIDADEERPLIENVSIYFSHEETPLIAAQETEPESLADQFKMPVEEVETTIVLLIERLGILEDEEAQAAYQILDQIMELPTKAETSSEAETISEQEVRLEMEKLFANLFEQMDIEVTPELVDALIELTWKNHLEEAYEAPLQTEAIYQAPQDKGTHEFITKLLAGVADIKESLANAYLIGKSAMRLYMLDLSFVE